MGAASRSDEDPNKKSGSHLLYIRFKIQEDGLSNGAWGTSKVINNAGRHAITIPKCLPDGQYLLRAEMIALHGAGSPNGAQLYVRPFLSIADCLILGNSHMMSDGMRSDQCFGGLGLRQPADLQHSGYLQGKRSIFLFKSNPYM